MDSILSSDYLLKGRGSKVEKIAFNNCLHMPLLAELLNSFDSLYMTDPFLYLLVMQTPFTLSNN